MGSLDAGMQHWGSGLWMDKHQNLEYAMVTGIAFERGMRASRIRCKKAKVNLRLLFLQCFVKCEAGPFDLLSCEMECFFCAAVSLKQPCRIIPTCFGRLSPQHRDALSEPLSESPQ
jgi:hypothetical protein